MVGVDEDAWIRTLRETLPELYAFVSRRVGHERTFAEDVTQETWLRAVTAWRKTGPPNEPLAWLKTTARNLLLNQLRDASRRPLAPVDPQLLDLDGISSLAHVNGAFSPDAAALVQHALSRLASGGALLVEAFHFDGKTTRELALEHGLSERAVEGRLHRARLKLKKILARSLR